MAAPHRYTFYPAGQVQDDDEHLGLLPDLILQSISDVNLRSMHDRILAEQEERRIEDIPPPPYVDNNTEWAPIATEDGYLMVPLTTEREDSNTQDGRSRRITRQSRRFHEELPDHLEDPVATEMDPPPYPPTPLAPGLPTPLTPLRALRRPSLTRDAQNSVTYAEVAWDMYNYAIDTNSFSERGVLLTTSLQFAERSLNSLKAAYGFAPHNDDWFCGKLEGRIVRLLRDLQLFGDSGPRFEQGRLYSEVRQVVESVRRRALEFDVGLSLLRGRDRA